MKSYRALLILGALTLFSGCSAAIYSIGVNPRAVVESATSKSEVRSKLGNPLPVSELPDIAALRRAGYRVEAAEDFRPVNAKPIDAHSFEVYEITRNVRWQGDVGGTAATTVSTLGALEVVSLPMAIYEKSKKPTPVRVIVWYDPAGRPIDWAMFEYPPQNEPNKAPEPTPTAVTPRALEVMIEVKQWSYNRDEARVVPAVGVAQL